MVEAGGFLYAALKGADVGKARLLGNDGNGVVGVFPQQTQGGQRAQIVDIGFGCTVDGLMAEELIEPCHRHAQQLCQVGRTEIGAQMRTLLFYVYLDERHQLSIVLQVCITLTFHSGFHDFAGRLGAST